MTECQTVEWPPAERSPSFKPLAPGSLLARLARKSCARQEVAMRWRTIPIFMSALIAGLALAAEAPRPPGGRGAEQQGARPAPEEGVIDPKADAALRRMSDYLGS